MSGGVRHAASGLRARMAAAVVAGVLLVAGVAWAAFERACAENNAAMARVAVRTAAAAFVELLRASSDDLGAMLGALEHDRALTRALEARDSRRLLVAAGPTFQEFRTRHGITHWNYWEPEAAGTGVRELRNVVRLGTPTLRGDLVERETLARVAAQKALVTGLELGYTGFVLRALAPVRDGERVVGYAELGRDVGTLLSGLKARTGDDFALVLDKRYIEPRRWASARAANGERNDWDDRDDLVLVRNATRADAALGVPLPPEGLPDGGTALGIVREGDEVFARGAFPVRDIGGRKVGAVYVLRNVTELTLRARELRREGDRGARRVDGARGRRAGARIRAPGRPGPARAARRWGWVAGGAVSRGSSPTRSRRLDRGQPKPRCAAIGSRFGNELSVKMRQNAAIS